MSLRELLTFVLFYCIFWVNASGAGGIEGVTFEPQYDLISSRHIISGAIFNLGPDFYMFTDPGSGALPAETKGKLKTPHNTQPILLVSYVWLNTWYIHFLPIPPHPAFQVTTFLQFLQSILFTASALKLFPPTLCWSCASWQTIIILSHSPVILTITL